MPDGNRVSTGYIARAQFVPFHTRKTRFACIVAHRRAGKTVACVNDLIDGALRCKLPEPRFAYVAPYYTQAKDVAWSYLKRFTQSIPGVKANESELHVTLPNQGRIRLYGADNYDRLRGGYLDGVILDEYADMDPRAWSEVIGPMLADRKGWAGFIGTPKGRNDFHKIYERSKADADWTSIMLRASETGLLDQDELDRWKREMTPEQYAQEFECSFEAAILGAYFGQEMSRAEQEGRIASVPWQSGVSVTTGWDLGIGDSTAIWFEQRIGREVHLIDYIENHGVGLDWYAREILNRPYAYSSHTLPHDGGARELGTGKTRQETLESLGLRNITVLQQQSLADGINAARLMLSQCWFDKAKCERGIEALRQYRREFDEERKVFAERPLHNWASHPADAFRTLSQARQTPDDFYKKINYPKRIT